LFVRRRRARMVTANRSHSSCNVAIGLGGPMRWLASGLLVCATLLAVGCKRPDETRPGTEPESAMTDEPPDPARSGKYVRFGLFKEAADGKITRVAALDEADVQRIVRRHADRTRTGEIIRGKPPRDGNGTTLGFVEGIAIVLRTEGELHVGAGEFSGRFEAFVRDLFSELGCAACGQVVGGATSSLIRLVPE
jgi:hypothetical protein